ncbi:hypothetical protein QJS10_CPA01g03007 [Acorus calamus]|uniref:Uncharacterized protein n=1 Tax=Acorus calamus TaxID=4465 RepID=A0AAV9FJP4_ACOCL|nr:hypothetical protein QJS10_CPA01g03007 [Acorus calamus]
MKSPCEDSSDHQEQRSVATSISTIIHIEKEEEEQHEYHSHPTIRLPLIGPTTQHQEHKQQPESTPPIPLPSIANTNLFPPTIHRTFLRRKEPPNHDYNKQHHKRPEERFRDDKDNKQEHEGDRDAFGHVLDKEDQ